MSDPKSINAKHENIQQRAALIFADHYDTILRRTDRLFAGLLFVEWLGAILAALLISPRSWSGSQSEVHLHVWAALLLGGVVISLPIYLGLRAPGRLFTRITIAAGQMLMSALLIHLTGGRIETHFHIFGSLAFLAFYRDWRVLATATLVVVFDHLLRGIFWPQSVFGVISASPWRWAEHAGWVVFEVSFLAASCLQGIREMKYLAREQARLESTNASIETEVIDRTNELRATEARLRLIVDAAPCGMVMMGDDGVINMVNHHMELMFGFDRAEMIGRPIEMLLPERFRHNHPALRDRFFQNPEAREMGGSSKRDLFGARRDGSEFPVEIGLNPLNTEEGISVLAAVLDVTEHKNAEEELKQYAEMADANNFALQQYAEEADAANRAKSEFLASMSHELRTPLNAIIGFSEGLLERVDRHPLNGHQMDRLTKIKKSGDHLLTLINNVLDLAKVEAGKVEVTVTQFDVAPLADEIAALTEGLLKDQSDVQFHVDLKQIDTPLRSDRDKIKQILINLVGNAAKFTEYGHIALRVEQEDGYIRMSVEDTGVGIPEDQLPKIFTKFHQIDQAQHRSIKGTGLGLALCKSFASLLGGTISVHSIEGQGSTFILSVPLSYEFKCHEEQQQLVEQIKKRCRRSGGESRQLRILCIEDDPKNMEVLVDFLEYKGLQVIPAFDGHSGLTLARDERPDAITLDVMMPGLDGWEVLRRLKADPATREIPVIITTAIDDRLTALNLGADDFLLKPIKGDDLCRAVNQLSTTDGCEPSKLAIVDDDADVREILQEQLTVEGYLVQPYESGARFLARVSQDLPDVVILDLMMHEIDGFGVLDALRSNPATAEIPVIVMTAKMLSGADVAQLRGRIRAIIEKNGLSRDRALASLIEQLENLKREAVTI